jgi:Putative restriction endonuclease
VIAYGFGQLLQTLDMNLALNNPIQQAAIALWQSILDNPLFRNLPYKIETTGSGAIMMSPASNWHASAQSQLSNGLRQGLPDGEIFTECSILTWEGVKVADVAWASEAFMAEHGYTTPYLVAPEICIEVVSPSNTAHEIDNKVNLYLAKGAVEVWVIAVDATVRVFNKSGQIADSNFMKVFALKKRAR